MLVLDEGEHMRQRKLLLPAFHGERLQALARDDGEVAERRRSSGCPVGEPFSLRAHTQAIALEVILRVVLGVSPDDASGLPRLSEPLDRSSTGSADPQAPARARSMLGPDQPRRRRQQARMLDARRRRALPLIRERRAAGDLAERERHPVDAAARPRRGRRRR